MTGKRPKVPTSSQPDPNLGSGQMLNEIKAVTTVPTYSPYLSEREVIEKKGGCKRGEIGPGERYGQEVGTVGTGPTQASPVRGRFVALNESGTQRIGEDHPRAKLTDAQVEAMRDDYEAYPVGHPEHMGYRLLAKKYDCSKRACRDICNFRKRNQWAGRWKRI